MRTDGGQAMVEFIVGIFALTLLISVFLAFGRMLPAAAQNLSFVRQTAGWNAMCGMGSSSCNCVSAAPSLTMQYLTNGGAIYDVTPTASETHSSETIVEDLAEQYIFGTPKVRITDSAFIPVMNIPRTGDARRMEAMR